MKIMRWTLLLLLITFTSAMAGEAFMPRYPALSPDGETVVFSFQGDLWSVSSDGGTARRLTAHEAYDARPVFSPDGSQIAFPHAGGRWGAHKADFCVILRPSGSFFP